MRTVLWVFATLALVSTIRDNSDGSTSNTGIGEKSWGILKEGVRALSYTIPGRLPNSSSSSSISSATATSSNDENDSLQQGGVSRGLHTTATEKNSRALKADTTDDDSTSSSSKKDASTSTTTKTSVGTGGGGDSDAEDISSAADDDVSTAVLDHMEDANKTSTLLPPESEEQPREWPATVLVIFLVLAAVLLVITGVRNCRKKSQYTEVPATSLIV